MTYPPDTLYRPKDLPLNEADLVLVDAHRPRASWCCSMGLKRHVGGSWQWYGKRGDGRWHAWGVTFDLSI